MSVEPSEAELLARVRQAARLGGWLCYHTHDSRRSDRGFPDLVLVRAGQLRFVELKAKSGRVSVEQQEWIDELGNAGRVSAEIVKGDAAVHDLCLALTRRPAHDDDEPELVAF